MKTLEQTDLHPVDWKTTVDFEPLEDYILVQLFLRPAEWLGRPVLVSVEGLDPEPLLTNLNTERFLVSQPYPWSITWSEDRREYVRGPKPEDLMVRQGEHYKVVKRNADIMIHVDRPFYVVVISKAPDPSRHIELMTPIRQVVQKKDFVRDDGVRYWDCEPGTVFLQNVLWENHRFDQVWRGLQDMIQRWMRRQGVISASRRDLKRFRTEILEDESFCLVADDLPYEKEWRQVFNLIPTKEKTAVTPVSTIPVVVSEGWLGLREMIFQLTIESGLTERDAHIVSWYVVPPEAKMTNRAIKESMESSDLVPESVREDIMGVLQDSFDSVIRRKIAGRQTTITSDSLGALAEQFVLSRIPSSLLEAHRAGEGGTCDISDREDGDPERAGWAVNVKCDLGHSANRAVEASPEHHVAARTGKAWVLLVMPRLLQLQTFPIAAEIVVLNSRLEDATGEKKRGGCVAPLEDLGVYLKRLISGELKI